MKIIHLINLLVSFVILDARYSLYHSDIQQESNSAFDCLYAYLVNHVDEENIPFMFNYNLIPYCRRLDQNEEQEKFISQSSENMKNTIKEIVAIQMNYSLIVHYHGLVLNVNTDSTLINQARTTSR